MNYKEITQKPILKHKELCENLYRQARQEILNEVNSFSEIDILSWKDGTFRSNKSDYRDNLQKYEGELKTKVLTNLYSFLEQSKEIIKTENFFIFDYKINDELVINLIKKEYQPNNLGKFGYLMYWKKNYVEIYDLRLHLLTDLTEPYLKIHYGKLVMNDFNVLGKINKTKSKKVLNLLLKRSEFYQNSYSLNIPIIKREIEKALIEDGLNKNSTKKNNKI